MNATHRIPSVVIAAALACAASLLVSVPLTAQGGTWGSLTTATSPGARWSACMAYDSARDRMVMVGGSPNLSGGVQETWEYDGVDWSLRASFSPSGLPGTCAVVYDAARNQVLALGSSFGMQTYAWNGSTWTLLAPAVSPSQRIDYALAYDSARQRVVLFGGQYGGGYPGDTWEWDGATWLQRSTVGPQGRANCALAYDSARGRTVIFGGWRNSGATDQGDLWEWNGTSWQFANAIGPAIRHGHAMVFDSLRNRVVVFGGRQASGTEFFDTWEWSGSAWTSMAPAVTFAARGIAAAFDTQRQRTFAYGGWLNGASNGTTSAYGAAPPTSFAFYGAGCAGPTGVPTLTVVSGIPRLGTTLTLRLGNLPTGFLNLPIGWLGFDNTQWNGVPLPLALDPLGFPGCTALLAPSGSYTLNNVAGQATWPLPIPFLPAFAGQSFYAQGGVLVLGFNPGGLVFTRGYSGLIGR